MKKSDSIKFENKFENEKRMTAVWYSVALSLGNMDMLAQVHKCRCYRRKKRPISVLGLIRYRREDRQDMQN